MTDSEQVPWGKGEKNPGRGVKYVLTKSSSPLMGESVPFAEWAGELWYCARLSGKHGAEAKASLNRAI